MQLSDLLHLCTSIFRPPPAPKAAARTILVVPRHESVDKPEMSPVLAAAAAQLATSGLLWKWVCTDGGLKLCSWDASQQIFLRGTVEDFAFFIGERWIVRDTNSVEYRGPSISITDRLIQAVLKHPSLPIASWALQLKMEREGTK
jgi:hypothetical protein